MNIYVVSEEVPTTLKATLHLLHLLHHQDPYPTFVALGNLDSRNPYALAELLDTHVQECREGWVYIEYAFREPLDIARDLGYTFRVFEFVIPDEPDEDPEVSQISQVDPVEVEMHARKLIGCHGFKEIWRNGSLLSDSDPIPSLGIRM
jgi:hypothetical protein